MQLCVHIVEGFVIDFLRLEKNIFSEVAHSHRLQKVLGANLHADAVRRKCWLYAPVDKCKMHTRKTKKT